MPKGIDPNQIAKLLAEALAASGKQYPTSAINDAIGAVTKPKGRRGAPKTATGGAGRKPPKTPKAPAASAPKPKPSGGRRSKSASVPAKKAGKPAASKLTREQKREMNIAKHWAERDKWLAEKSAESQQRKAEKRALNQANWAKRQEEMEARRLAGREKYNKKKKGEK